MVTDTNFQIFLDAEYTYSFFADMNAKMQDCLIAPPLAVY